MDFALPAELTQRLAALDEFIEAEIRPLEEQDDNARFFDHRREWARTDFEGGGVPRRDWEELLGEMFRRADAAGWLRYGLPAEVGGSDGTNLDMAVIREHLAHRGLGLHNDLQNESSVVGNFPFVHMVLEYGTAEQREEFLEPMLTAHRARRLRPLRARPRQRRHVDGDHGRPRRRRLGDQRDEALELRDALGHPRRRVRPDVRRPTASARGITAFFVPVETPGFSVDFHWWTLNMPTDHAEVTLRDVRVPDSAIFGEEGGGLAVAQTFVHENRIRQAASGVGAGQYCVDRSVAYARERRTFGEPLATRQAIQWPLVELQTEAEMLRGLVRKTAWELDRVPHTEISDRVSMCNYRANRFVCDAADRAMQVHGGLGYSRHTPFEHIYRHHRRYRITEGAEEVQMRKVAAYLFGFAGPNKVR